MSPHFVGSVPRGQPPPVYDLTGVVNHYGGILGGHYTAYVRTPDVDDWKKNEIGRWRNRHFELVVLCVYGCTEERTVGRNG